MKCPHILALVLGLAPCLSRAEVVCANIKDAMLTSKPVPPWRTDESPEQRDARMAWWREAKFGMFVHWGPYAVYGAVYRGKPHKNSEWIYENLKIPVAEYKATAARFKPDAFDATALVSLAKRAGQKYIVITAKHHDGFALWPSKVGGFNFAESSGFTRDPLGELAAACKKEGIRLGFYYSQALDFTYPGGGKANDGAWDPAQDGFFEIYFNTVAIPQVNELLTRYGPDVPAVLWFDVDANRMNPDRIDRMLKVVRQHPSVILNNRIKKNEPGDYGVAEAMIPPRGYSDRDWEAALMTHHTWGYSTHHTIKSTQTHIHGLIDAASKGGNVLLNVAPDADGKIPEPVVQRLEEIGQWLKVNGEAIYASKATCFGSEAGSYHPTQKAKDGEPTFVPAWEWRCTTKPGKMYLHFFKWPTEKFALAGVTGKVSKAYLLAERDKPVPVSQDGNNVVLTLPDKAPDPIASVVCVELSE